MTKDEYISHRLESVKERFISRISEVSVYLYNNNIKNVVFGYSGGRDSTFVLLLLTLAKLKYFQKDLNIYPISIEYKRTYKFDTFKDTDVYFVQDQKNKYLDFSNHNWVSATRKDTDCLKHLIPKETDIEELGHQSNYQYMYHLLFTIAQAKHAITIGTTNLDEISYIGWFGKNSDMCVDLQFIADFHKFEIDYLLKSYGIAIADVPKGDLYSGLSDEEVFNTSYVDLAYYSYCKCKDLPVNLNSTLENLHTKNHHKYMGQTFNPYFIKDDDYYFIYKKHNY